MPHEAFFKLSKEKQDRIVAVAMEEFLSYKDDYKKASVKRIAKKADIAIGSIYLYFSGKDDLFFYVLEQDTEKNFNPVIGSLIDKTEKDIGILKEMIVHGKREGLIEITRKNPSLLLSYMLNDMPQSTYYKEIYAHLQESQSKGLLCDDIDIDQASYLYSWIDLIAYFHYSTNKMEDELVLIDMLHSFYDMFFNGIYKKKLVDDEIKV